MKDYIIQKIIDDQQNNINPYNTVYAQPVDMLQQLTDKFTKIPENTEVTYPTYNETSVSKLNPKQNIVEVDNNELLEIPTKPISSSESLNSSTYENIMAEIQQHEKEMETAIHEADELSKEVKESIMYFLSIRKPNKNGILINGIPDVLQASARLLDLSINGRHKLASMKKLRASILKDMLSKNNSEEFSLMDLLNG